MCNKILKVRGVRRNLVAFNIVLHTNAVPKLTVIGIRKLIIIKELIKPSFLKRNMLFS